MERSTSIDYTKTFYLLFIFCLLIPTPLSGTQTTAEAPCHLVLDTGALDRGYERWEPLHPPTVEVEGSVPAWLKCQQLPKGSSSVRGSIPRETACISLRPRGFPSFAVSLPRQALWLNQPLTWRWSPAAKGMEMLQLWVLINKQETGRGWPG